MEEKEVEINVDGVETNQKNMLSYDREKKVLTHKITDPLNDPSNKNIGKSELIMELNEEGIKTRFHQLITDKKRIKDSLVKREQELRNITNRINASPKTEYDEEEKRIVAILDKYVNNQNNDNLTQQKAILEDQIAAEKKSYKGIRDLIDEFKKIDNISL